DGQARADAADDAVGSTAQDAPRRLTHDPPIIARGEGKKRGRGGRALVEGWALARPAAHQQVVNNPDDRQHQQQVNQPTADPEGEPEEPQHEEHDYDRPDQTGHEYLP